jgi:L-lactate dehydrogenase complex protein LldG
MTPDARAAMRAAIAAAIGRGTFPDASADHPGVFSWPPPADDDRAARFRAELEALGGTCHDMPEPSADAVVALLDRLIAGRGPRRVLMWDEALLPVAGLPTALVRAGISIDTVTTGDMDSIERREELASATIGLTGADAALAETGSIVLASGPGRARLASLLPPIHVALVERHRLVDSLAALIRVRPDLATAGANVVCITGPSRTADIEHTLSRGVHGPGEVHVVFVG